jgi:phosphoglycerol geranylgeranyltransferase
MNTTRILSQMQDGRKKFAVLIDPDKQTSETLAELLDLSEKAKVDFFFFGGSLLTRDQQDEFIRMIKNRCEIPVVLFPGNHFQISYLADSILFLSLISGRNPELLIGKHVIAAPYLKKSGLEVIPTGYMLIEGGNRTTVEYMSNTTPIPAGKPEIASCTAIAGELLGFSLIYMDAGSGAGNPVPCNMIRQVRKSVSLPLIIGGGIRTPRMAKEAWDSGADIVVVGNAIEDDPALVKSISKTIHA